MDSECDRLKEDQMLRTKIASEGKVFAYKDENGEEIVLGSILYLGVNDDGSRYYEIDAPAEVPLE